MLDLRMERRLRRMIHGLRRFGPLVVLVALVGCVAPSPSSGPSATSGQAPSQAAAPRINRTLVMAGRSEVPSLGSRPLRQFGLTSLTVSRLFNAGLSIRDGEGAYHPYLAEALPQLNSDSWKVFPDGRMETTYRLKPGLLWQDGTRLTSDDFVFAHEVYSSPE